jgi:hypothetical protein
MPANAAGQPAKGKLRRTSAEKEVQCISLMHLCLKLWNLASPAALVQTQTLLFLIVDAKCVCTGGMHGCFTSCRWCLDCQRASAVSSLHWLISHQTRFLLAVPKFLHFSCAFLVVAWLLLQSRLLVLVWCLLIVARILWVCLCLSCTLRPTVALQTPVHVS